MTTKKQTIKIKPTTKPLPEIGVDLDQSFIDNLIEGSDIGKVDVSSIDALNRSAQNREQMYQLIDSMSQDDIIAAVLETYAEDTVQTNDSGQVIWVESSDSKVLDYTKWLLDSLNIDKHIYQWAYCLLTYGDVYIRLYRKSDYGNDLLFNNSRNTKLNEVLDNKEKLNEDTILKIYSQNDPYIPYVEMVSNPGEMFDLQKFGKTYGYIKAPTNVIEQKSDELYSYLTRYKMNKKDVEIYDAMSFAHCCLENTTQRQPETVDIFLNEENNLNNFTNDSQFKTSYSVKRGQSILYNSFRVWRQLNLLEMSALLNRLTKSSLVRVLNVDVGDMPKEQVRAYIQRLKEKMEQKSAIDVNKSMQSYNNPGPIENTIYVPTHEGKGAINASTIGGDFDPKSLTDIEYFRDKLFGSLKVPKQFFGFTEDGAGFNGGTSLTLISSRYGKTIKKIQNCLCQLVTDILNLFLIDRGLDNYVNKFTIRMQTPMTQEEKDRREATDNRIRYIGDLMNQLGEVEDKEIKLKIYKSLLIPSVNNSEVIQYLDEYIGSLKKEKQVSNSTSMYNKQEEEEDFNQEKQDLPQMTLSSDAEEFSENYKNSTLSKKELNEDEFKKEDSYLPSPEELNLSLEE